MIHPIPILELTRIVHPIATAIPRLDTNKSCCVEDIQFCGVPCKFVGASGLKSKSWVMVTAKISAEKHPLYKGELGPILTALNVESAQPAEQEVVTF